MNDATQSHSGGRDSAGRKSPRGPRFGPLFTIAVAILLLFGAVSHMGRVPEAAALFGIDTKAANDVERTERDRLKAALILGGKPVSVEEIQPHQGSLPLDRTPLPPQRERVDLSAVLHHRGGETDYPSAPHLENLTSGVEPGNQPLSQTFQPPTQPERERPPSSYVVADGDTWAKIAKRLLGDSKRWMELQQANPAARDGLRVGMRLVVPQT